MDKKLCVYSKPFPRMKSNFEKIDVAVEYGMPGVECFNNMDFATPDEEAARRMKDYADEKNIIFPCFSVYADFSGDNFNDVVEMLKGYARVAKIMDCPYLHHTIISECFDPDKVTPFKNEYYKKGIEGVRKVYDYAESIGIKAIYEDQGYIFNGVEGFGNFLADVNRDVGVVADFGNVYESCDNITDFIKAFKDKICHAHLKDMLLTDEQPSGIYMKSLNGKYVVETDFGKGSVDFKGAIDLLKSINYKGYFGVEYCVNDDNSPMYDEALKYAKAIMKEN